MAAEIIITGALGNVGAQVVSSLVTQGVSIGAADLLPEKIQQRFGAGVDAIHFDYRRVETFAQAMQGKRSLFLMRPPQIANVRKYMFPAIDAAKAAGVTHVVFLSLIDIDRHRMAPHYQVEQYLRACGMRYTFLRCSFFMQNLNTAQRAEIRDRDEIYVPVGTARTSFIDVRDIGAVAAMALTQSDPVNRVYELTGAEALSYFQVAEIFTQVLGRIITYKNPSASAYLVRQLRQRTSSPYALVTTWLYTNTRKGMAERVTGEVAQLLGRPPITMHQYIDDYKSNWMR